MACIGSSSSAASSSLGWRTRRSSTALAALTPERMARTKPSSISKIARRRIRNIPAETLAAMTPAQARRLRGIQLEYMSGEQFLAVASRLPIASLDPRLRYCQHQYQFSDDQASRLHEHLTAEQRCEFYGGLMSFQETGELSYEDVRHIPARRILIAWHGLYADRQEEFFRAYITAFKDCTDHRRLEPLANAIKYLSGWRSNLDTETVAAWVVELISSPAALYGIIYFGSGQAGKLVDNSLPDGPNEAVNIYERDFWRAERARVEAQRSEDDDLLMMAGTTAAINTIVMTG